MTAKKRCILCGCYFLRPEDMDDDHWDLRKTCKSEYCQSKVKSNAGKLGGIKSRSLNKLPFVMEEVKPEVKQGDRTWDPLEKYAQRESKIAWLFK